MKIEDTLRAFIRAEVARVVRGMSQYVEDEKVSAGSVDKPKRARRPRAAKPAPQRMRDADGNEWAGRGRKPAGFDTESARPVEQMAA